MNKAWFDNIKWDEVCLECMTKTDEICPNLGCAEHHYDKNGNLIPPFLTYMDGSDVDEYLRSLE